MKLGQSLLTQSADVCRVIVDDIVYNGAMNIEDILEDEINITKGNESTENDDDDIIYENLQERMTRFHNSLEPDIIASVEAMMNKTSNSILQHFIKSAGKGMRMALITTHGDASWHKAHVAAVIQDVIGDTVKFMGMIERLDQQHFNEMSRELAGRLGHLVSAMASPAGVGLDGRERKTIGKAVSILGNFIKIAYEIVYGATKHSADHTRDPKEYRDLGGYTTPSMISDGRDSTPLWEKNNDNSNNQDCLNYLPIWRMTERALISLYKLSFILNHDEVTGLDIIAVCHSKIVQWYSLNGGDRFFSKDLVHQFGKFYTSVSHRAVCRKCIVIRYTHNSSPYN